VFHELVCTRRVLLQVYGSPMSKSRSVPKWIFQVVGLTPAINEDGEVSGAPADANEIFPFRESANTADAPSSAPGSERHHAMAEHLNSDGKMPRASRTQERRPSMGRAALGSLRRTLTRQGPSMDYIAESERKKPVLQTRGSQIFFADPSQTCIIFDWDDTLFPTEYVCKEKLDLGKPMNKQRLARADRREISTGLGKCAYNAARLLEFADTCGKVVVVTLARRPWVEDSCKNFYPGVAEVLKKLDVKIVYAQEARDRDYDKEAFSSSAKEVVYWAKLKGGAIAKELYDFYSQYEGQTWKNVISIGDSDFERLGTMHATSEYLRKMKSSDEDDDSDLIKAAKAKGTEQNQRMVFAPEQVEANGHLHRVRTKTFKMLDSPKLPELIVELELVRRWLKPLVELESSFNLDLDSLGDAAKLQAIEETLNKSDDQLLS